MKWRTVLTLTVVFVLAGCTKYVPVPCPPPPEIPKPEYAPIDTTAPPHEQMRQIVDRFMQCAEYSQNLETVLEEYRK